MSSSGNFKETFPRYFLWHAMQCMRPIREADIARLEFLILDVPLHKAIQDSSHASFFYQRRLTQLHPVIVAGFFFA